MVLAPDAPSEPSWSRRLAGALFATQRRWGWRAIEPVRPAAAIDPDPGAAPEWVEPMPPDTSNLVAERNWARRHLLARVAFAGAAAAVYVITRPGVQRFLAGQGFEPELYEAYATYGWLLLLVLALPVLPRTEAWLRARRNLARFLGPYRLRADASRAAYDRAFAAWQEAVDQHARRLHAMTTRRSAGPRWEPVAPAVATQRVDVIGGDARRHGWASLLVMLGTSVLGEGQRLAVLDLTGADVAGGLLALAAERGLDTRHVHLSGAGSDADLLAGLGEPELVECLTYAFTAATAGADQRHERALTKEVLEGLVRALDGPVTLERLAAGMRVLRRAAPPDVLAPAELERLAEQLGALGTDDWTGRRVRLIDHHLGTLAERVRPADGAGPLWPEVPLAVVATPDGRGDDKRLLDQVLVQLAQHLCDQPRRPRVLVVAGVDHLGAGTLDLLAGHARRAGVRLVLMIDHPQGTGEAAIGTGGAVCVMKMYNHRDAEAAASFIGREHTFVLSETTVNVGRSFSDGGRDGFAVSTGRDSHGSPETWPMARRIDGVSDSRGQAWTGTRTWNAGRSVDSSWTASRVHEFTVDPERILGLPETAFILVDNAPSGRQVVLADCNPGLALLNGAEPE
ncbi:hypothetical protein GCM10010123_45490 [Pilimelia anulata]|uniref:Uncharacterized protein n=1 Tax=Pilimelia anulata TaxID=53371 RepID=A0A8J3FCX9_9ACTN|nr:hypothetical protein [Pilimelia anulata]GGK10420.1 hypothetical protein GCM10010123_45490 [Pilimelia anulata]